MYVSNSFSYQYVLVWVRVFEPLPLRIHVLSLLCRLVYVLCIMTKSRRSPHFMFRVRLVYEVKDFQLCTNPYYRSSNC